MNTPAEQLSEAISSGDLQQARKLLQAHEELRNPESLNPLLFTISAGWGEPAAYQHSPQMLQLLLEHRASADASWAAGGLEPNERLLMRLLFVNSAYPLEEGACSETKAGHDVHLQMVGIVVAAGAELNVVYTNRETDELYTPLSRAVELRRVDLVALLLDHGADPSCPDDEDFAPLAYVVYCDGTCEMAALLLSHGADPMPYLDDLLSMAQQDGGTEVRIQLEKADLILGKHNPVDQPLSADLQELRNKLQQAGLLAVEHAAAEQAVPQAVKSLTCLRSIGGKYSLSAPIWYRHGDCFMYPLNIQHEGSAQ